MSNPGPAPYVTIVSGVCVGAIAGAGLGRVIGGPDGVWPAALAGAGATALCAYLLERSVPARPDRMFPVLVAVAALACGLMGGFFFGFSALIMRSLAAQPTAAAIAVMQTINVAVFNPWFGIAFVAAPAACVLVIIVAVARRQGASGGYAIAGGACYLAGTLLVTALCNVPRNDALAAVAPDAANAAGLWATYLSEWTLWNHVRTVSAFAAAAALTFALVTDANVVKR